MARAFLAQGRVCVVPRERPFFPQRSQGWDLPKEFATLRRVLESRTGRRGKREFVQVLRLFEHFRLGRSTPRFGMPTGDSCCPTGSAYPLGASAGGAPGAWVGACAADWSVRR